jgi:hypothetical protein
VLKEDEKDQLIKTREQVEEEEWGWFMVYSIAVSRWFMGYYKSKVSNFDFYILEDGHDQTTIIQHQTNKIKS